MRRRSPQMFGVTAADHASLRIIKSGITESRWGRSMRKRDKFKIKVGVVGEGRRMAAISSFRDEPTGRKEIGRRDLKDTRRNSLVRPPSKT